MRLGNTFQWANSYSIVKLGSFLVNDTQWPIQLQKYAEFNCDIWQHCPKPSRKYFHILTACTGEKAPFMSQYDDREKICSLRKQWQQRAQSVDERKVSDELGGHISATFSSDSSLRKVLLIAGLRICGHSTHFPRRSDVFCDWIANNPESVSIQTRSLKVGDWLGIDPSDETVGGGGGLRYWDRGKNLRLCFCSERRGKTRK